MTNKVKPFFIRITEEMTPQMVQDVFDKCHKLGVRASNNDDVENLFDWGYFGVCARDGTYLSDSYHGYFDAQEITIDQLDEWLGLEAEQEWKNGDECVYQGKSWHFVSILSDEFHGTAVIFERISEKLKQVDLSKLEKPETPEQKAERERLEGIKEMAQTPKPCGFAIYDICEQLYDAGYRKQ